MHATKQEIINFLKSEFAPSLKHCTIVEVGEKAATLIWHVTEKDLRPGNTVSGPTMMTLADFALYVAILGEIGIVGLAVTTNMNINFGAVVDKVKYPSNPTVFRAVVLDSHS